jgi:hypothetical protein
MPDENGLHFAKMVFGGLNYCSLIKTGPFWIISLCNDYSKEKEQ